MIYDFFFFLQVNEIEVDFLLMDFQASFVQRGYVGQPGLKGHSGPRGVLGLCKTSWNEGLSKCVEQKL